MRIAILTALLLTSAVSFSQTFNLIKAESKMSVQGTSTLHDWESEVKDISLKLTNNNRTIDNVELKLNVRSIKSGKSGMDDNTYKAMKADKFPHITLTASGMTYNGTTITGTGKLTIAGVSKTIPLTVKVEEWNAGSYHLIGTISMKMSDHGITPPTAMLGAIKTGDDIKIVFDLILKA